MLPLVHGILSRFGIRAYRRKALPVGADEVEDVRRGLRARPQIIFDVGANVGSRSLLYAREFREARVYAFEPFSETFERLQANTAAEKRIHPVRCAMGAAPGTCRVPRIAGPSEWNSLKGGLNDGIASDSEELTVSTVDRFCAEHKIDVVDLLKTDTEGFDLEVLRGAAGMLADRRIRVVLSECAFDRSDRRHTSFFDLYDLLAGHGYHFLGLSETIHRVNGERGIDFSNALFCA